ncbi:MAG: fused MFS/spermidine synthase [Ignavibacteriales bacterium]|nr:fused MFS/spermidine synthase [Ignavibacteriales bacterium]
MNRKPGSKLLSGLLFSKTDSNFSRSKQLSLFYIGFSSILSQILLVREFLVSFYGNELSIGIIFACWLVWIGLGSAFGNFVVNHNRNVSRLFLVGIAVTPLVTFVQILAVKFVRVFLPTTTGEFLSMLDLFGFSFVVLSIGCFLWGMLFTLGAKSLTSENDELWLGVNKAYVLESFGSVVGGLLFSFVFAVLFSTLQIVFLIVVIAWGEVFWIMVSPKKWFIMLSLAVIIIVFVVVARPIRSLENTINSYQWSFINSKLTFVRSIDTKYQNLSLLYLDNQSTVFADGRPAYNIPNAYDAELFTHPVMIHHSDAKRVLVLGGGFNGVLKEVLRYSVHEVQYVEIDPALLPFVEPVMNIQDQQALHDSRVHFMNVDGRELLRRKQHSFDVILMNVGEPSTASLNRFYTVEFFQLCYQSLNGNGIFAFSFPSSTEYLADELKNLNASLYQTFNHVFTNSLIVPGTHAVLMGTTSSTPLISQPDSLAHRYTAAGISAEYFSKYMFAELMPPDRINFITNTLESAKNVRMNTDDNPVTYYYDLLLWNKFLHGSNRFLTSMTRYWIYAAGGAGSGLLLLLFLLRWRQPEKQKQTALAAITTICGMTGMALNLLFLLNFQEAFGSIYEMVGAMIAANMLGLALGTQIASRASRQYNQKALLLAVLITLMSVVLFLPKLLDFLLLVQLIPITLFVTIVSGGLIGMLFGIANRLYLHRSSNVGSMYAFDVFGSSIGALTTCSVLLPVLGIEEVAVFLSLLLLSAVLTVLLLRKQV